MGLFFVGINDKIQYDLSIMAKKGSKYSGYLLKLLCGFKSYKESCEFQNPYFRMQTSVLWSEAL